jgi:ribose 5-phosphate isomerase A
LIVLVGITGSTLKGSGLSNQLIREFKIQAARHALESVQDGMIIGLGSGSTSARFVDVLGEKVRSGAFKELRGVPTSDATAQRARDWGIPVISLSAASSGGLPHLDLAVDGADEVDPSLNLIKGLGRALLREKVVEIHAERFIVIVDESKLVPRLGSRGPLPVEIIPYEAEVHVRWLNSLGCKAELWREDDGTPVVTDDGMFLARCWFEGGIPDPYALAEQLSQRPGIVEHGLFLDMADMVVVAGKQGIRILER